jgi:hypothetical protein
VSLATHPAPHPRSRAVRFAARRALQPERAASRFIC